MNDSIKQRIYKYDNVKFLAILCVVIGHCIEGLVEKSDMYSSLFVFIYTFHMPLFIFLYGLFTKRQNKDSKFQLNKFTFFIALGLCEKALRTIVDLIFNKGISLGLMGTSSIEWFMFTIAFYLVFIFLLKKVNPVIVIIGSIIAGCLIALVDFSSISTVFHKNGDFLYLQRTLYYLPFFFAGYYLTPDKLLKFVNKVYVKIISVIFLVAYFIFCFRMPKLSYSFRSLYTGKNAYVKITAIDGCFIQHRLLCYAISSIIIIAIIAIIPNIKIPVITHMGGNTLSVYFWHNQALRTIKYLGVFAFFESLGDPLWKVCIFAIAILLTLIFSTNIANFPIKKLRELCTKLPSFACYIFLFVTLVLSLISFYII